MVFFIVSQTASDNALTIVYACSKLIMNYTGRTAVSELSIVDVVSDYD